MSFEQLELLPQILKAVTAEGYTTPTPIQARSIPHVLEGRDLLGCAQTGTGKTAAFALPILHRLTQNPRKSSQRTDIRALILSPTRELATQIGESFRAYGRHLHHRSTVIFGGVGHEPQRRALRQGVDILIATPGRLLDLMNERLVRLAALEILVLDEADRMLDMGFIHDVRRILKAIPRERQTLFFSATMPRDIQELADDILSNPAHVEVTPQATTAEKVDQKIYFVAKNDKRALLVHLLQNPAIERALVFTRTKHGADRVVRYLSQDRIQAQAIHGNKSQGQRERALGAFKTGRSRVLVATDIAARGIDVEGISHVINFDLPNIPESYVHRIGRTARAGASGHAISFCDGEERAYLRDIERTTRQRIPIETNHPFANANAERQETRLSGRNFGAGGPSHSHDRGRRQDHGHRSNPQGRRGDGRNEQRTDQRHTPRPNQQHSGRPSHGPRQGHGQSQKHAHGNTPAHRNERQPQNRPHAPTHNTSQGRSHEPRHSDRTQHQQHREANPSQAPRPRDESFGNTLEGSHSNDYGKSVLPPQQNRLARNNSKYRW